MIYGLTFTDRNMTTSAKFCKESMLKHGVQGATIWEEYDLGIMEMVNKDIFDGKRGAGCYWLFKPWIIYRTMQQLKDGDILIYSDAGVEFINDVSHIIDRMNQDMFLFTNTHPNHHWTKRYTLDRMQPNWERIYEKDTPWPQVQASVIFTKICKQTRDFIKCWLLWCQMPGIITDEKGPCGEYPFFQDHRHDQSVLSILASQACYTFHWWPTAYAEHIRVQGDTYPVLFNHHRKRDPGCGKGEPEW